MIYPKALFRLLKENPGYAGEAEEILLSTCPAYKNPGAYSQSTISFSPSPGCVPIQQFKVSLLLFTYISASYNISRIDIIAVIWLENKTNRIADYGQ